MAVKKKKTRAEQAAAAAQKNKSQKKKAPAAKNKPEESSKKTAIPVRVITSIVWLALFVLFIVIFFNPTGKIIEFLGEVVRGTLGQVGFAVSIPALLYMFFIHAFSGKRPILMRSICLSAFVIFSGCISQLVLKTQGLPSGIAVLGDLYFGGISGATAGWLCGGLGLLIQWLCGNIISYIILIVAALLTLLGSMNITIPSIIRAIQERPRPQWEPEEEQKIPEPAAVVVNHIANKRIEHMERQRREAELKDRPLPFEPTISPEADQHRADQIMKQIGADVNEPVAASGTARTRRTVVPETPASDPVQPPKTIEEDFPETMPELEVLEKIPGEEAPSVADTAPAKLEKVTAKDAADSAAEVALEIEQSQKDITPVYYFPPIELLKMPPRGNNDATAEMRENSQRLNETLASFKIEAHIINVTRGPSVTRYEVELEKGVRLSKLTSAADDIALSLGASGVRIAAVPGKISVVGIEVPNRAVTTVSLREVIDSQEFSKAKSMSSFAVGKDISGNCIIGNIAKLPHMLIAGTTGSGKSVCINCIIMSILYKASPRDVKLILIDPKKVEFQPYRSIPHLYAPIVTDPKKAAGALASAVAEMERRFELIESVGAKNISGYNELTANDPSKEYLPYIVIIIDELADLMMTAADDVETAICRIAQKARAAGIHLIVGTQRPSVDVVTGLIKANIPSRIAFTVASQVDSKTILDTAGADKLIGRGDMLFAPIGSTKPMRVQGAFIDDREVEAIVDFINEHNDGVSFNDAFIKRLEEEAAKCGNPKGKGGGSVSFDDDGEPGEEGVDPKFKQALDVAIEMGKISTSLLQRRLEIGYGRAAKIIDRMEALGYVSAPDGNKPRAVLVSKAEIMEKRLNDNGEE